MNITQMLDHILVGRAFRRILDQERGFRRNVMNAWIVRLVGQYHSEAFQGTVRGELSGGHEKVCSCHPEPWCDLNQARFRASSQDLESSFRMTQW